MSEPENSKLNNLNNLIISESNYSCEYFDEDYIKQKNEKNRKLYNLEEKEQEIYDNQEEYSKKMFRILSMQKKQFNSKYNKLKKEGEFNTYYYDDYNNKIKSLFNEYNKDYNNSILNLLSEFNNNWIFPKTATNLSNNSFKKKCDIKSCNKKFNKENNINNINNKINYKSKSCHKLFKTYRTSIDNSAILNLKAQFNNDINNKYKTDRNYKYNSAVKMSKIKPKNRTARTSVRNSNNKNNNKYILNSVIKNGKINFDDKLFNRQNNKKYLTKNNFYPKSLFLDLNKDKNKFNFENGFSSTKTSFRNSRINNDINNSKSLKQLENQFNFYNFNISNNKKFALKQNNF